MISAGVTFAHGFDHWLRSDPAYWTQVSVLAMFCALIVLLVTRIMKLIA